MLNLSKVRSCLIMHIFPLIPYMFIYGKKSIKSMSSYIICYIFKFSLFFTKGGLFKKLRCHGNGASLWSPLAFSSVKTVIVMRMELAHTCSKTKVIIRGLKISGESRLIKCKYFRVFYLIVLISFSCRTVASLKFMSDNPHQEGHYPAHLKMNMKSIIRILILLHF